MTGLFLYLLALLAGLVLVNVLLLREVSKERRTRKTQARDARRDRTST